MPDVHLINHTHWDREWFLTHEYTTAWIPDLIDALAELTRQNPEYEFLFDGQSLVIEDLLSSRPDHVERVRELVASGNLVVGPLYSQPDWRMVSGELHLRNLRYGISDADALGGSPDVAWLVDTFGHVSQAPQMLALAGIDAAFVWRGVPQMTPLFVWEGADGTRLQAVDLFGGYRNLYGITKTPDIAVDRLEAEVSKLADSYGNVPIPLFDGYDLDTQPEDPVRHYEHAAIPDSIVLVPSSPRTYADATRRWLDSAPTIRGELLSGKYGATFPGSLSARTHLKVMHHDAEHAIHRVVEPLAVLAGARGVDYDGDAYELASRELLKNGVHDCICGVSIDQVHERMQRSYRRLIGWADERMRQLTTSTLAGFAPGTYAVSTSPMPVCAMYRVDGRAVRISTGGVGVWPVVEQPSIRSIDEAVPSFDWSNDHYSAHVDDRGIVVDGCGPILQPVVRADDGDTYSSEPGAVLGELGIDGPITIVDETDVDVTVRFAMSFRADAIHVSAIVLARFDDGPLIDLTVTLDSTGTGFRVDARFETGLGSDRVWAGMPFDTVERPHVDIDLLDHDIDSATASILMGQRETGDVTEFPFQGHVAIGDGARTAAILTPGPRAYRSFPDGRIDVALRRAVEWLALPDLSLRSGDAGPMMYVPGARSEQEVTHRIGFVSDGPEPTSLDFASLADAFLHPPIVATVEGSDPSGPTSWPVFSSPVPCTALFREADGTDVVRLVNPTDTEVVFAAPLARRSIRGHDLGPTSGVRAKEILTATVPVPPPPTSATAGVVTVHSGLVDRVGRSRSLPEPAALDQLSRRTDELEDELEVVVGEVSRATGRERHLLTHRRYVIERELLEIRLSHLLNTRLLESDDEVSIPDEPDPDIATLGAELNDLRVKRRIYDYVAQALAAT